MNDSNSDLPPEFDPSDVPDIDELGAPDFSDFTSDSDGPPEDSSPEEVPDFDEIPSDDVSSDEIPSNGIPSNDVSSDDVVSDPLVMPDDAGAEQPLSDSSSEAVEVPPVLILELSPSAGKPPVEEDGVPSSVEISEDAESDDFVVSDPSSASVKPDAAEEPSDVPAAPEPVELVESPESPDVPVSSASPDSPRAS